MLFSVKAAAEYCRYSCLRAPLVSTSCTKRKQQLPPTLNPAGTVRITDTKTMIMDLTFFNNSILDLFISLLAVIFNCRNPLLHAVPQAIYFSYIKQNSNQSGLTEYNSVVRLQFQHRNPTTLPIESFAHDSGRAFGTCRIRLSEVFSKHQQWRRNKPL
jgi:hypothetical protein